MQAVAGLKYRFKNGNDTPERGEVAYKKYVQMGIGTGAYGRAMMRTPNSDRFTLNAELMTGRWFTPVSGFRIGLTNNNVAYRPKDEESHFNLKIFGLQLDYMINLTNLFGEVSHTRPVDLNGFFGVGINYGEHKRYIARTDSFDKDGDFAPSGAAGLQAIFNVSKSFGIYVEPAMYIYGDKIDAHENNRVKIDPAAKLTVGTIFKF